METDDKFAEVAFTMFYPQYNERKKENIMKLTVVYHSKTGNTKTMAEIIADGMNNVNGAEAKAFPIEDIDEVWAKESKCIVVGSPIYVSSVCGAVKLWLDGPCKKYELAGKLGGAFATADYIHGGGDLGIRLILDHLMVYGMLTYSGGSSLGKPFIHLGPVAINGYLDEFKNTFRIYGERMAIKAMELY